MQKMKGLGMTLSQLGSLESSPSIKAKSSKSSIKYKKLELGSQKNQVELTGNMEINEGNVSPRSNLESISEKKSSFFTAYKDRNKLKKYKLLWFTVKEYDKFLREKEEELKKISEFQQKFEEEENRFLIRKKPKNQNEIGKL